ncbi:MAG: carboxypeptidase-like regulatory domain-containing protein, partial [Saprospiraceae bacterium]|nr:carboxypeptidase-like regulatory domain-containing protein [Saprospiraceae bacterium]
MKVSTRRDTYITRIILNMLHRIKKLLMSIQLSYRLSPKFTIFLLSLLFSSLGLFAQKDKVQVLPTQTIRGEIQDLGSHQLLVGATVELWKDSVFIGTTTDEKGQYRFDKLPLGRYWMEVRFLGYETIVINEILLESGKEFIQDIWLRENPELLNPIIITAAGREVEALQKLSAHTITVEETFRFPATFNDPVRLAMSYPGVVSLNDQANGISIRGNSPNAMQWRLEGVEIVNPNHLSNAG